MDRLVNSAIVILMLGFGIIAPATVVMASGCNDSEKFILGLLFLLICINLGNMVKSK